MFDIALSISLLLAIAMSFLSFLRKFADFHKDYPMFTYVIIVLIILIGTLSYFFIKKKYNEIINKLVKQRDILSDSDDLENKGELSDIEDKLGVGENTSPLSTDFNFSTFFNGVSEKKSSVLDIDTITNDTNIKKMELSKGHSENNNFNELENIGPVIELEDGALESKTEIIDYNYFKGIYQSEEFMNSFASAIKLNLNLKRERYLILLKQMYEEYKIAKKNCPPSLIPNPRYQEQVDSLASVLTEIKDILKQIKTTEKELSEQGISWVSKRLVSALSDKNNGLDNLVGRDEIKDFLALRLYTFAKNPRIFFSTFQNIALYAPSGYGKTKIAQTIGWVYSRCGILIREKFQSVTKSAMTTAYVNESGPKTRNLLLSNLEGVLFIDEAYDITPPTNSFGFKNVDHGHEAVTELVNFIDKMTGLNIIIAAGYPKAMKERFMKANQGMPRRFPHIINLQPYKPHELTKILLAHVSKCNPDLDITKSDANYTYTVIENLESMCKHDDHLKLINQDDDDDDEEKGPITFFPRQGGDMLNISADIANAYYGNIGNKDLQKAIIDGFNTFLANKSFHIKNMDFGSQRINQTHFSSHSHQSGFNIGNNIDRRNQMIRRISTPDHDDITQQYGNTSKHQKPKNPILDQSIAESEPRSKSHHTDQNNNKKSSYIRYSRSSHDNIKSSDELLKSIETDDNLPIISDYDYSSGQSFPQNGNISQYIDDEYPKSSTPTYIKYDNNNSISEYDDIIFNNMKDDGEIYEKYDSKQKNINNHDSDS